MRITAVILILVIRQDRCTKARTPKRADCKSLTQSGIERTLTLDLHAAQIQGFFDIPVDNLYISPVFALDVKHNFKSLENIVVSPDAEEYLG